MRRRASLLLWLAWAATAGAQTVVRDEEILASDRPEAWAMNYVTAASLMTSGGAAPGPGAWRVAGDLRHVPTLSRAQQQVGFGGAKAEDLNKSPVFGRLRIARGFADGWHLELGYTPPLRIDGVRVRDLFALAVGKQWMLPRAATLSLRAFGQHGSAHGDITCPAEVAGPFDAEANPFGCVAPSSDRIALNHYGVQGAAAIGRGGWRSQLAAGLVRNEPAVQVDARVFTVRDRSHLVARGVLPFFVLGVERELAPQWRLGVDLLHVPLDVRREPEGRVENDAYTALALRVAWDSR